MSASERLEKLRARYLAAQLAGDRREALRLAVDEGLGCGLSVEDVQTGVIQEAQREIGRLWEEDKISVAEEHLATAISQVVLAQLYVRGKAAAPNGKKVVVACVPDELHDFPARLVADALDLAGFEVLFLGANVPAQSLCEIVERESPALVALSVTMPSHAASLHQVLERLKAMRPQLPVAVGGHALEALQGLEDSAPLAADITARDARGLVSSARRYLGIDVA